MTADVQVESAAEAGQPALPQAELEDVETPALLRGSGVVAPHPTGYDTAVVFDFGSQTSQLIVRRVREAGVYCELLAWDASEAEIRALDAKAIILSGGPASVYEDGAPKLPPFVLESGLPVLGICYGSQLLAYNMGGRVAPSDHREFGPASVASTAEGKDAPLLRGLSDQFPVWMSHGDRIDAAPDGFTVLGTSANAPFAAMGKVHDGVPIYGIQFHPEVVHTPDGAQIIRNFLFDVAGLRATWSSGSFIEGAIANIRALVGEGRVLCGLSGGVDSAVVAAMLHRAIGPQLTCIFVDTGLLRLGEADQVMETFGRHMQVDLRIVHAEDRFLAKLAGVADPEQKRKIIGAEFVRVFEEAASGIGQIDFLAQGTLYPDVIESSHPERKSAARIKTHHNVGGLPADMKFRLIEPLRYLFKDEARAVGTELGLPDEIVWRQPFPGPGLAVRVLGAVDKDRVHRLQLADAIMREELRLAGLEREIWQSFAVLTNIQSVGVMGDYRTYSDAVAIRAVTSVDGMTADWARIPYEVLTRISNRIVNEVAGVNRVVYDITSKPPATIEWE